MKIKFEIPYNTKWGENLFVQLYPPTKMGNVTPIEVPLHSQDGKIWTGDLVFKIKGNLSLNYHYEVRNTETGLIRKEWTSIPRVLQLSPAISTYFVKDNWRDLPAESWLYTSCMTDVFRKRNINPTPKTLFKRTLILKAQTPTPEKGETLFISGASDTLGNWDLQKAIALTETAHNEWSLSLDIDAIPSLLEYKFIIKKKDNFTVVWEEGKNHLLTIPQLRENEVLVVSDLRPQFSDTMPFKAAGVVIPVFSLRSKGSCGCGDFGDLTLLTNWVKNTNQKIIQILPINDTTITHTWTDSYPYNAISVYALHPIYTDMRQLPPTSPTKMAYFEEERKKLNMYPQVPYEQALKLKLERLKLAFEQVGDSVLASEDFKLFFYYNVHWLPAYAMFCVLRDEYGTADYKKWPKYSKFSQTDLQQFCVLTSPYFYPVRFWYYVQYVLHCQLKNASQNARKEGIILKGDIPIGISPYSVDAWMEPHLFNLNSQAGAPPDDFSAIGQNWGFPTYNWDEMQKDNYLWWQKRFAHMANYFDAYRIDHVLGFFRIWEIPSHSIQGILGQFTPSLPLTKEEIASFGLQFKESYLTPYITDEILEKVFAEQTASVKQTFLIKLPSGKYALRPNLNTQKKVEDFFAQNEDTFPVEVKNQIFALISNVLFVRDIRKENVYHPRISALNTSAFEQLSIAEQQSFRKLYNNYFFERHNDFWAEEALKKLPVLTQSTRLLCCAEDLGMIPACVPDVMKQLQMLSLEIQRMPKKLGECFADTNDYPYLSVATPGTHDMSTLRGWWTENRENTQKFWDEILEQQGNAPLNATGAVCEAIINMHLKSPAMLTLISLQDWLSMDETLRIADANIERINVPANPKHYWRYRMHICLEDLLQKKDFNTKVRNLITNFGR